MFPAFCSCLLPENLQLPREHLRTAHRHYISSFALEWQLGHSYCSEGFLHLSTLFCHPLSVGWLAPPLPKTNLVFSGSLALLPKSLFRFSQNTILTCYVSFTLSVYYRLVFLLSHHFFSSDSSLRGLYFW